jgi:hypothetical protein
VWKGASRGPSCASVECVTFSRFLVGQASASYAAFCFKKPMLSNILQ